MSYDISFRMKNNISGEWIYVAPEVANITWNLREMIMKSTGLTWRNEADNGNVVDFTNAIKHGLEELNKYPKKYTKYESPNGWGTIEGCRRFFSNIIDAYEETAKRYPKSLKRVHVWID